MGKKKPNIFKRLIDKILISLMWLGPVGYAFAGIDPVLVDSWRAAAPTCEGYVSKQECGDGDSTLFAGLLCLSGEDIGCDSVRDAQAEDGQWFRSPRRVDDNLGKRDSFSRDQALGVLSYLLATRDTDAAYRWYRWISKNRPCIIKIGSSCRSYGLHRLCKDDSDNRCTITPNIFNMMYHVWKHIGLEPSKTMAQYKNVPLSPIPSKGYQIHLFGIQEWLRQKMERSNSSALDQLAEKEPLNPFYMYLNRVDINILIGRVLEVCPREPYDQPKKQWSWERLTEERAWEKSMLWDCVFISRLIDQRL